ncbi:MAG: rubredoxin [Oscillospiraceae bacterium]
MARYGCMICGWIYDEELGDEACGIEPGTLFEDLPDDFECPECGCSKDQFAEAD